MLQLSIIGVYLRVRDLHMFLYRLIKYPKYYFFYIFFLPSLEENVFRTPFNTSLYRILCKDGKVKPLGSYAEIETECALSFGVAAEV